MSTMEIEQRLARIRTLATQARNGHPINVGELGNEFLTLDAQLADGAELPEAWAAGRIIVDPHQTRVCRNCEDILYIPDGLTWIGRAYGEDCPEDRDFEHSPRDLEV